MGRIKLLVLLLVMTITVSSCSNGTSDAVMLNTDQSTNITGVLNIGVEVLGGKSYKFIPQMKDLDKGSYTFAWTFGDGGKSEEKEPVYTYNSAGVYTINLELSSAGKVIKTARYNLTVTNSGTIRYERMSAKPDYTNDRLYIFEVVASTSNGDPLTYEWNFGDGQTISTENSVTEYEFGQYGRDYTINLTVRNTVTNDYYEDSVTITIPKPALALDTANVTGNVRQKTFQPVITGVANISDATYTWNFGDGTTEVTYDSSQVLHEFPSKNGQNSYTTTLTVTSPALTEALTATATVDVTVDYALTGLEPYSNSTDNLTFVYGIKELSSSESGLNGIYYMVTFQDGEERKIQERPDSTSGNINFTKTYDRYYNNYNVTVKAYSGENILLATTTIRHSFEKPTYALEHFVDPNEQLRVTFQVVESYHLSGATYEWDFGSHQTPQTTTEPTVTHTYTTNGDYTVKVIIRSDKAPDMGTVSLSKNIVVTQNIVNNTISCNNNESTDGLTYECTSNASITSGILSYNWTVDGKAVPNSSGKIFKTTLDKYNKAYTIKLVVSVLSDPNITDTVSQTINTPKPVVTIEGKSSVIAQEVVTYSARYEISTTNGTKKEITLKNKVHSWLINNSVRYSTETINHSFGINDSEGLSVIRNVDLTVTTNNGNLNGSISTRLPVTVNRPPAGMEDIQSISLACSPVNDFDLVKQNCRVNITFKAGRPTNTDNFTARFEGGTNGVQTAKIGSNAQLIFDWPAQNVTGKNSSKTYEVTASVYRNDNVNNTIKANTNITVRNYVSYVLFPMPYKKSYGGSGTRMATYSCGYNTYYSNGSHTGGDCAESSSTSGQTLNLGNLVDASGKAKANFTAKWGYNINYKDGRNKTGVIATVSVTKGQSIPDSLKKFDIEEAFKRDGTTFVGEVYGQDDSNNVFYLEISGALSKPLRVTYNGNNFTSKGNRLTILAPTMIAENYDNVWRQCHIRNISTGGSLIKMQAISVYFYFESGSVTVTPANQMLFSYRIDYALTNGNASVTDVLTQGSPVAFNGSYGKGINDNNNIGSFVIDDALTLKQFTNSHVTLNIRNMLRGHATQNTFIAPYRTGTCFSDR